MFSARSLAGQRNNPFLQGCGHGRSPVIHAQLAENMNEVGFDRCRADVESFADFFIAHSFGHQLQHFNLAGAQGLFDHSGWAEVHLHGHWAWRSSRSRAISAWREA